MIGILKPNLQTRLGIKVTPENFMMYNSIYEIMFTSGFDK